jgi:hypothetical protein
MEEITPEPGAVVVEIVLEIPEIGFTPVKVPLEQVIAEGEIEVPDRSGTQLSVTVLVEVGAVLVGIRI